ncbi:MAG: LLM class flavin-dependent oxidoreductase [Streptosporangiales bacterium]|nr:LLM class flavin-dependent oxidoreductase [Streptosporangiales bacterium]
MKVGVMLDSNVGPAGRPAPSREEVHAFHRRFLDCGRMLDGTAVDGVFVAERHGRTDCLSPAPLEQLAALAGATSRLRLGTYVLMPPLYPPLALLERLAVVDHLSGGRLVCGFGAGYHPGYAVVNGATMANRGAAFDAFLDEMERGWQQGGIWVDGQYVHLVPPAQRPRPPVWIGGTSAPAARRAARHGDAFAIGFTDRRVHGLIEEYRAACAERGRTPRLALIQSAWVHTGVDPRRECLTYLGATLAAEMALYQRHGQVRASGEITADRMLPYMYVGEPDEVVEHVRADVARFGVDEVILRVHVGIPPPEAVAGCLELIVDRIAPELNGRTDAAVGTESARHTDGGLR